MDHSAGHDKWLDYRVNFFENNKMLSVEITCCGKRIGEIRFKDGESRKCPDCGAVHTLRIQHNHFHLSRNR